MRTMRTKRLENVNELIQFIAETDHARHNPTLGTKENGGITPGHFFFAANGFLYYVDSYTKAHIRPLLHAGWDAFSEGGTMREVVQQLAEFILDGKQGFLNDYKEIWGWQFDNMMKVRKKAFDIGFIRTMDYPYERWVD